MEKIRHVYWIGYSCETDNGIVMGGVEIYLENEITTFKDIVKVENILIEKSSEFGIDNNAIINLKVISFSKLRTE